MKNQRSMVDRVLGAVGEILAVEFRRFFESMREKLSPPDRRVRGCIAALDPMPLHVDPPRAPNEPQRPSPPNDTEWVPLRLDQCAASHMDGVYWCTLAKGHEGAHQTLSKVWVSEDSDPPRESWLDEGLTGPGQVQKIAPEEYERRQKKHRLEVEAWEIRHQQWIAASDALRTVPRPARCDVTTNIQRPMLLSTIYFDSTDENICLESVVIGCVPIFSKAGGIPLSLWNKISRDYDINETVLPGKVVTVGLRGMLTESTTVNGVLMGRQIE